MRKRRKYRIEYIRKQFEKRKFILKSIEYVNAHTKLDYICPNGHEHSISWYNFQRGKGCPYCVGLAKLTIDFVKGYIEGLGWVLKSKKYINAATKLECICDKGHECTITWNNFQQGKRCSVCAMDGRSTTQSYKIPYIKEQFEKRNWILKSDKYINCYTKLDYVCDKGHEGSISWTHFQQGIGCPTCSRKIKPTIEDVSNIFNNRDFVLKSTVYINGHSKLDYICPNGHEHSMSLVNFQSGNGCPTCANIRMTGERSPSWRGGITNDPYCDAWFDKGYKLDIKSRDVFRCQNPYCSCNGGAIDDLCIHHIDYDKQNCHPSNLIVLCRSCHSMSNGNREFHILWFQTIMNHKYGYTY